MKKIFIIDYKRTPIGSFMSELSNLSAFELANKLVPQLIKEINKEDINRIYIGNVLSSGNGQNIARQIGYTNNINCPSITLNRICGSGMQSIIEGYKSIILGETDVTLVGGTESMSNSPHICKNIRRGCKFGNIELNDSMLVDGLTDFFSNKHMGELTEDLIEKENITKEELDTYALHSYENARNAYSNNFFSNEVLPIEVKSKRNTLIINEDEEVNKIQDIKKIYTLKGAFKHNGSLTAGNSSKLSDGACLILLASEDYVLKNKIKPIAEIIDYDLSVDTPDNFSTVPINSILTIMNKNSLTENMVDYFEINEAFASVPVMVHKKLNISYEKINPFGGAISMGHPLGCSGARILSTLLTVLKEKKGKIGIASICNGGGGATSLLVKMV